jgi:hypothetical protein
LKLLILLVLLGTVLIVWFEAATPIEDDFRIENPYANGTSNLRALNVQPLNASLQALVSVRTETATSILAFLAPQTSFTPEEASAVQTFLTTGGTVLVADNFGTGNSLLADLNVPVRFGNVTIADSLFYEASPNLPTVYDLSPQLTSLGVNELALNRAVPLQIQSASVSIQASTSPFSFEDLNGNGQRASEALQGPFPILAEVRVGQGLLFIFSSPGTFSNGMLNTEDDSKLLTSIAGGRRILLDQAHLGTSFFSQVRILLQRFIISVAAGTLDELTKLTVICIAAVGIVAWWQAPKIEQGLLRHVPQPTADVERKTIDEILKTHPGWSRGRLEYVEREIALSRRWRRKET